jgi:Cytochrome P460
MTRRTGMRPTAMGQTMMRLTMMRSPFAVALIAFAFVATAALSGRSTNNRVAPLAATVNENASLPAAQSSTLPANPLKWRIISSSVDPQNNTMSTLYGNDTAIQYARSNTKHDYPPGSQIALVTWTRRDDPRYFGAKIPEHLKSVEFVLVTELPGETKFTYEKFEGSPLAKTASDESANPSPAAAALLNLRAAVLP